METLSHIFLHLTFCAAMATAPGGTQIPVHISLVHHNGVVTMKDSVFKVDPGKDGVVEFDVPWGIYRMTIDVPKYRCGRVDFLNVLEGANRTVSETLTDELAPPAPPDSVALVDGLAPQSFAYLRPVFVLFDKSQACNQPVGPTIPVRTVVEYDQGSYHLWLHADAALLAQAPYVAALRLRTPTSTAHYVRVKIPFPTPWGGWPNVFQMNVTEDMVDGLATEKVDTLLCPKVWSVSVPD
jgi:hypothetical protein